MTKENFLSGFLNYCIRHRGNMWDRIPEYIEATKHMTNEEIVQEIREVEEGLAREKREKLKNTLNQFSYLQDFLMYMVFYGYIRTVPCESEAIDKAIYKFIERRGKRD